MTLNRRAFAVLLPIVLLGHILAGGAAFLGYRTALVLLHKARVQQELFQLKTSYSDYVSLEAQLLYVIRNSSAFMSFINESDQAYRTRVLAIGIQDSLQSLVPNDGTKVSCSVFQSDGREIFYFDNGLDPFQTLGEHQAAFAHAVLTDNALSRTGLVTEKDGTTYLLDAAEVQARGNRPVSSGMLPEQSVLLQIAVKPSRFETIRHTLAVEYGAPVELSATPPVPGRGLSASVRLAPALYARVTPAGSYMRAKLTRVAMVIGMFVVVLSVMSVGVLMLLVRRYIIAPIEELDRQVTAIMEKRRIDIDVPERGEIGRLAANVRMLHGQLARALRKTRRLYETDSVTGIGNRIYFNEMLERFFLDSAETGRPLTMLFIDLDNFKQVNDEHGHRTGDALLVAVAKALVASAAETAEACNEPPGIAARLSGDEFAFLIQAEPRSAAVQMLIQSFLVKFRCGFSVESDSYPVTASVGVAAVPGDADTPTHLMSCADHAMYYAKAAGRNTFAFYSDLPPSARTPGVRVPSLRRSVREQAAPPPVPGPADPAV
ncbi:diguanylate cyclase [Gluconacetobacter diazotrophicus]|uniref:Diguanylate cyclase n=1 Tax=Gluconacetobacter diazotrophicus TaxID=33996 RepID=A0A7W4I7C1_GLUDI|nr:diguanylate cyclase [Gluconacetobacter diazotrophicus]MBB2157564.1 diguanylate cyclase [Gluconacetobacter diazotrophicus]